MSLKKHKVPLEDRFAVVSSKAVEKGKKVLYQRTPKGVLNGQFAPFMPGDDRGMNMYLMIYVVTRYYSLMITDPSVTGCAFLQ